MNIKAEDLLEKINLITQSIPLIYFTRDSERSLGLENVIKNFHVICIEDSYIVDQLLAKGIDVFCAQKEKIQLTTNSTKDLVKNDRVQAKIKEITNGGKFYAQFFQYQMPTKHLIEKLGGIVLNNSPEINRELEDKLTQYKFFKRWDVSMPISDCVTIGDKSYLQISEELNSKNFVLQLNRSHTGQGTFFIHSEAEYDRLKEKFAGNEVKVSEYVDGEPYTVNALVKKNGEILMCPVQYQITGYSELADGLGTTVGNDWSVGTELSSQLKDLIYHELKKIGSGLKELNYIGHFGIDFIVDKNDRPYVIEINGRQTANASLETKLAMMQDSIPLMLLHLAEFLGIDYSISQSDVKSLQGSQVFLRNRSLEFSASTTLKSGIYRLLSDNSAVDWTTLERKENVIYLDEDMDKPVVWQTDGYSVQDISSGGFVLLVTKEGIIKEHSEELARMQFKDKSIYNNKLAPWILEAMKSIAEMIR